VNVVRHGVLLSECTKSMAACTVCSVERLVKGLEALSVMLLLTPPFLICYDEHGFLLVGVIF
jgi:hypothetical protein